MIRDSGELDPYEPDAVHEKVGELPLVTLPYILPSRYCEADSELLQLAWDKFGKIEGGWAMVQAGTPTILYTVACCPAATSSGSVPPTATCRRSCGVKRSCRAWRTCHTSTSTSSCTT